MKVTIDHFNRTHTRIRTMFTRTIAFLLLCVFCLFGFSCAKKVDYFLSVSELRSNILLAEGEGYRMTVYAVTRETPYRADGIPQDKTTVAEFRLTAPEGQTNVLLDFAYGDKSYGGDMSYDNVKSQFYYSCTLDISQAKEIPLTLQCGESKITLTAKTVLTESTLTPKQLLKTLTDAQPQLFKDMTDKYGFCGEIYLRLIHEDANYYYVGVIDRNQKIRAFLLNAENGKILAKRDS